MADGKLISESLRRSDSFREDLKLLLSLSEKGLRSLAKLGDTVHGFESVSPSILSRELEVDEETSDRILHITEYLFLEMIRRSIDMPNAVTDLTTAAKVNGIELGEEKIRALHEVFGYKKLFETGDYAMAQALIGAPHFVDLNGRWLVTNVKTRANESVRVPIVALNISWHDSEGNEHSGFFHMSEEDWADLRDAIADLDAERSTVSSLGKGT